MKVFLLQRKRLTALACALAAAAIFYAVNYPAAVSAYATDRQLPIYCVQRDQKMVSISFDAAWGNEDTQQLIDIMSKYQVRRPFLSWASGWTNTPNPSGRSMTPGTR